MSRKVFTAGEVLAAADVNSFLMDQTVMSFAGTAARGSAIGTAVEGMVTYLEDIDDLRTYNGSSWVSPFALTLIKTQTIGTTVGSVVVSDVFSSEYDNYLVQVSGGVGSADGYLNLTLGSTSTGYNRVNIIAPFATGVLSSFNNQNTSSFVAVIPFTTNSISGFFDIQSPFLAKNTHFMSRGNQSSATGEVGMNSGYLADTTSYTSFTFTTTTGTVTGGIIRVYGYRK